MQDLVLLLATVSFLAIGLLVPFVLSLGYVWVDVFSPHQISASLLSGQPVSLIMGASAFVIYLLADRKSPPRITTITVLQILLCIWITLTTQWAVAPEIAATRWDGAIKAAAFATFLPFVIRSRVQIEALALVYLFSIAAHTVPWGVKTFFTGGGYGQSLGLLRDGSFVLEESSVLSGVCIAIIPFVLVWRKHSILLPRNWVRNVAFWSIIIFSLAAAIGTFARTALVASAVGGTAMWLRSKRKMAFLAIAALLGIMMFSVTSDKWTARISTVSDYQNENSAYVRILVWKWALNFVGSHPFGGGFWAYMIDRIEVPDGTGGFVTQYGRAWHNIFIAVLAEHGFPGFFLYVGMIIAAIVSLQRIQKLTRKSEANLWCADFAQGIQVTMVTMYAAGNFVEFGWQPALWYLFSMTVSLREYVYRACELNPVTPGAAAPALLQSLPKGRAKPLIKNPAANVPAANVPAANVPAANVPAANVSAESVPAYKRLASQPQPRQPHPRQPQPRQPEPRW